MWQILAARAWAVLPQCWISWTISSTDLASVGDVQAIISKRPGQAVTAPHACPRSWRPTSWSIHTFHMLKLEAWEQCSLLPGSKHVAFLRQADHSRIILHGGVWLTVPGVTSTPKGNSKARAILDRWAAKQLVLLPVQWHCANAVAPGQQERCRSMFIESFESLWTSATGPPGTTLVSQPGCDHQATVCCH